MRKYKLSRVGLWLLLSLVLPFDIFPSLDFFNKYLTPASFGFFTSPVYASVPAAKTTLASAITKKPPKIASASPVLKFSVISDIHVESTKKQSQTKFKQALNDLNKFVPDSKALIVNGDLGNGLPEDYTALKNLMKILPHPKNVFYTMGNHEYYKSWVDNRGNWNVNTFPNGEKEKASQARFLQFAGREQIYDDSWLAGYHFIFLGSEQYQQSDPANGEDAWLSDAQLIWLELKIKEKADLQQPIFVFLHQPLPHTVAGSESSRGIVQYTRLKDILSKYPQVIFFTSHTHWELKSSRTLVKDKFTMVNTSSVFEPFDDTDHAYSQDLNMSEGLNVEVYQNRVIIRGRDFSHDKWIPTAQFSIPLQPLN
jgi:3',5'-cyclic-AMP phosphodiesterase